MLRNATLSRQAQQHFTYDNNDDSMMTTESSVSTGSPTQSSAGLNATNDSAPRIPSIRLINATPSATGLSASEASGSVVSFSRSLEDSWEASAAAARAGPVPPLPSSSLMKKASSSIIPKQIVDEEIPRRKLVPKKSKIGIRAPSFGSRDKSQDFSDVLRRVGAADKSSKSGAAGLGNSGSSSLRGGFEIYVDPTVDPEMADIVMIKKKKSRAALDGMRWGGSGGVLGEVTNVPKVPSKDGEKKDGLLKVKENDKDSKWWSIGRGRKDSKDEKEKKKEAKAAMKPVEFIFDAPPPSNPPPRSKTPDLLSFTRPKLSKGPSSSSNQDSISRGRFNSLDSGILLGTTSHSNSNSISRSGKMSTPPLGTSSNDQPESAHPTIAFRSNTPKSSIALRSNTPILHFSDETVSRSISPIPHVEHVSISQYPFAGMRSATPTPTMNGLLAPPTMNGHHLQVPSGGKGDKENSNPQGSIALRAIRSVKSLARIGNWQVKDAEDEGVKEDGRKGTIKEKKKKTVKAKKEASTEEVQSEEKKDGTTKVKKTKSSKSSKKEAGAEAGSLTGTIKRKVKKSLSKKDLETLTVNNANPEDRHSTSSFEIGQLTSSPSPVKVTKVKNHDGSSKTNSLGVKKRSILGLSMGLGLGLPSTMRMRSGSTASSIFGAPPPSDSTPVPAVPILNVQEPTRLSVDNALALGSRGRSPSNASNASSGSSLRPISTHSTISGHSHAVSGNGSIYSSGSGARRDSNASGTAKNSGASIRWSSEVLEREKGGDRRASRESRRSSEGRRRGAIVGVFPELGEEPVAEAAAIKVDEMEKSEKRNSAVSATSANSNASSGVSSTFARRNGFPIVTIEEATCDGHACVDDESIHEGEGKEEWRKLAAAKLQKEREEAMMMLSQRATCGSVDMVRLSSSTMGINEGESVMSEGESESVATTPIKKTRVRPMSEQLLGKMRPQAMHEDEEGVLSILDAATNDLALLINVLDLQATPSTPGDLTPYKPSAPPSPLSSAERKRIEAKISMDFLNGTFGDNSYATTSSNTASGVSSPLGGSKTLRGSMGSVSSLRPYAQSRGGATRTVTTPLLSHMTSLTGLNAGIERQESIASLRGKLRPASSRPALRPAASIVSLKPKKSTSFGGEGQTIRLRPTKTASANDAAAAMIARPIKPWSDLLKTISPQKPARTAPTNPPTEKSFSPPPSISKAGTFRRGHKRTMTPAPEPEPAPVFQPLKPATRHRKALPFGLQPSLMEKGSPVEAPAEDAFGQVIDPGFGLGLSSLTKAGARNVMNAMTRGSKGSTVSHSSKGSIEEFNLNFASDGGSGGSLTPVFKRIFADEQERAMKELERETKLSIGPSFGTSNFLTVAPRTDKRNSNHSIMSVSELTGPKAPEPTFDPSHRSAFEITLPLTDSACIAIGRSARNSYELNSSEEEEDVDVPEELKFILRNDRKTRPRISMAETVDFRHSIIEEVSEEYNQSTDDIEIGRREIDEMTESLSRPPPDLLLPNFQFTLSASTCTSPSQFAHEINLLDSPASTITEGDTRNTFDFTGELKKLNESGASDRRSFVEQLENAFRTPAKVDLRCGFSGEKLSLEVPPVPELSLALKRLGESMNMNISVASEGADTTLDLDECSLEESVETTAERIPLVKERSESLLLKRLEENENLLAVLQPSLMSKSSFVKNQLTVDEPEVLTASQSSSQLTMSNPPQYVVIDDPEPTFDSAMENEDVTRHSIISSVSSTSSARLSPGVLNTSFKFGGLPRSLSGSTESLKSKSELTLSDIIPSPAHARKISECSVSMDEEDRLLESLYAKIMPNNGTQNMFGNDSIVSEDVDMESDSRRQSIFRGVSRPASGISFAGFDSFDEVRRGFEFSGPRPTFYPPTISFDANRSTGTGSRVPHNRRESVFSFASVSSYGHVIHNGAADPFDFGVPMASVSERPSSEDMSTLSMSMTVDDTFDFMASRRRRRVESDASTFSFHAPAALSTSTFNRSHPRRELNLSVASQGPPISLFNRSFGRHSRNESSASMNSFSFARPSNVPGFRRQHERDMSVDSIMSDFSGMHLGRPGVGEKMFDRANEFVNAPLSAISASPENSFSMALSSQAIRHNFSDDDTASDFNLSQSHMQANRTTFDFDSLIDVTRDASTNSGIPDDSLFDKTGYNHRVSMDGESVFGNDDYARTHFVGRQYRPLSVLSTGSVHAPAKEDDTLISMLGGGHVRRCSVGSIVNASPCARVEKRKHSTMLGAHLYKGYPTAEESPAKARIVESPIHPRIVQKPSIASTSSFKFGMISTGQGLLERRDLEDSVLVAEGEDNSGFYSAPVFSRPPPKGRTRSSTSASTCTSSSGGDTPPLSASDADNDGSSASGGSQSSIDFSHINALLANSTHPIGPFSRPQARARARGAGHRRRFSAAHMSRSSVYETIEEEHVPSHNDRASLMSSVSSASSQDTFAHRDFINNTEKLSLGGTSKFNNDNSIYVVDPDTASLNESTWDDERGIVTLRKFYALRDEATETVSESKRVWADTPFSLYALQSFQPPHNPTSMQALLAHSVENYGPLPSELRPRRIRSRTSSRASPYAAARATKAKSAEKQASPQKPAPVVVPPPPAPVVSAPLAARPLTVLRDRTANPNLPSAAPVDPFRTIKGNKTSTNAPSLDVLKTFSPLVMDIDTQREKVFGASTRPRVPSTTRRNALGWTKRSDGPTNGSKLSNGSKSSTGMKSSTGPKTSSGPGKENVVGTGMVTTSGDGLRISRPRPKTRATPLNNARTIRI